MVHYKIDPLPTYTKYPTATCVPKRQQLARSSHEVLISWIIKGHLGEMQLTRLAMTKLLDWWKLYVTTISKGLPGVTCLYI
jgi:hypothetical protein